MLKSEMGFTYRELVYGMSYQNLIMLSSAIPSYKSPDKGKKGRNGRHHEHINAEDPRNRDNVKAILYE